MNKNYGGGNMSGPTPEKWLHEKILEVNFQNFDMGSDCCIKTK